MLANSMVSVLLRAKKVKVSFGYIYLVRSKKAYEDSFYGNSVEKVGIICGKSYGCDEIELRMENN